MARQSTASLSVVPVSALQRLDVPTDLTEAQAALWADVVGSKPAEWFQADSAPLLKEYVRAVGMCDLLAVQIEATLTGDNPVETALLMKGYLDMRDKESKRVASLATKLRLTQQSRYTPQSAATADRKAGAARPWQTSS